VSNGRSSGATMAIRISRPPPLVARGSRHPS
jgi:hypothetical protein